MGNDLIARLELVAQGCDVLGRRETADILREAAAALTAQGETAQPPRRAQGEQSPAYDLVAHLERQRAFSEQTFGPGPRTDGVCDHIRKELTEISLKPHDISEWIDVVLLALDGAWRAGYTPHEIAQALAAKQAKNEARQWPDWRTAAPGKAIEHVREVGQ